MTEFATTSDLYLPRTIDGTPASRQIEGVWWKYTDDGTSLGRKYAGGIQLDVRAGNRGTETVRPAVGDEWERQLWARHVSVYVSPTGRSVRVWVDGRAVAAP